MDCIYYTLHRNLCYDLYNEWLNTEMWDKFSANCRYTPSEEEMANCILDSESRSVVIHLSLAITL